MTVYDYLKFMANLRRVPDSDDAIDEALEMVHMQDRAEGYIGKLSKGMRQRIGLAQALLHKPDVLILDEPTIGLDPAQIIEVRKLIVEIGKEKTVLLSTHILSEAQQICNRVLIINKGHIVVEDTPEKLQGRLTGAQHVTLQVRGGAEELLPVISKVPGVLSAVVHGEDSIVFEASPSQDARPAVARAVIQAGFDLLELQRESVTQEQIFLELTRDEPNVPTLDETISDAEDSTEEVR
jgi:ABC-2 type transport system ATP-binding protein